MKYIVIAGGILSAILLAILLSVPTTVEVDTAGVHTLARYLPDHYLTPGVTNPAITQATIKQTICNPKWSTKSIRPSSSYTDKLKVQQIAQYGYTDTNPKDYEEDHFLPLTLGGNPTDPKNLWPEQYAEPFGARDKDKVEVRLNADVCSGKMTLKAAQTLILNDWTNAYKQLGLDKPVEGAINTPVIDTDDEGQ